MVELIAMTAFDGWIRITSVKSCADHYRTA